VKQRSAAAGVTIDLVSYERAARAGLRLDLQPSVHSVTTARRVAIELLRRALGEDEIRIVGLLTSELVTNAVVHSTTPFALDVTLEAGVVRVAVGDGGAGQPCAQGPGEAAEHGRGLQLVADLSSRWGTTPCPGGKQVWFELDVAPPG
jgi:anti-sigma regulatory factor (Ser/Thr protein kinase)